MTQIACLSGSHSPRVVWAASTPASCADADADADADVGRAPTGSAERRRDLRAGRIEDTPIVEASSTGRARRSFTPEFKAYAVRLADVGDRSIGQVAKSLDLTETTLREWVRRARVDGRREPEPPTALDREELLKLRREVRRLGWGGENPHLSTRHRG